MKNHSAIHRAANKGFSDGASTYASSRRTFPSEAMPAILDAVSMFENPFVLDLGAGTGRFTEVLWRHCKAIVAVEPLEKMRAVFAQRLPSIGLHTGSASAIPLPTSSFDIVTCVDAFHWFADPVSLAEIRRVLRPNGKLLLIWTTWDRASDLVNALFEVIMPFRSDTPSYGSGQWRKVIDSDPLFQFEHQQQIEFARVYTSKQIIQRLISVSFISALPAERKNLVRSTLQQILQTKNIQQSGEFKVAERVDLFVYTV